MLPSFPASPFFFPPFPRHVWGGAVAGNMEGRLEAPSIPAALYPSDFGQGPVAVQGFTMPLFQALRRPFAAPSPVNIAFQPTVSGAGDPELWQVPSSICFLVLVSCPWGPTGLGPHFDTCLHTEPCPYCGPSGQQSPSCDSCLYPHPSNKGPSPLFPCLSTPPSQLPKACLLPTYTPHTYPAGSYRVS